VSSDKATALLANPDDAFNFFTQQAMRNRAALNNGITPEGRVYYREGMNFPPRKLDGITLTPVVPPEAPTAKAA